MSDTIPELRARIDAVDEQVLQLLNERARIAHRIGEIKGGAPAYRPEREAQVLRRLQELNAGPLPASAVRHLFTEVISACRALEQDLAVAYLGPRGTFSEEAALRHFGAGVRVIPCASIDDAFRCVESGQAGFAVVPVENSTEGAVGRSMDLLVSTSASICGEVALPVHQCLMGREPDLAAVRRVYGHAQSLGQCRGWLAEHLPGAEQVPVGSNAEGAQRAAGDAAGACLGSATAAPLYELSVLAHSIEDRANNITRFLVLAAESAPASGRDKTSLIVSARNRPGAMHELLEPLARHGVSMTRLESRPSRAGLWEYLFFIDLEGHQTDHALAFALADLQARASFLKILGSYPAAL